MKMSNLLLVFYVCNRNLVFFLAASFYDATQNNLNLCVTLIRGCFFFLYIPSLLLNLWFVNDVKVRGNFV